MSEHPDNIAFNVIRKTLLNSAEVSGLVGNRIVHRDAPEGINYPYIVATLYTGGEKDETLQRAYGAQWKVIGYSANRATSKQLQDAIFGALHRREPDTTNYTAEQVLSRAWMEDVMGVRDAEPVQNTMLFTGGGIYKIRLTFGDNV